MYYFDWVTSLISKVSFLILTLNLCFCTEFISLKNRLLVPFYFKYGVSFGYNDNIYRFSDSEKNGQKINDYIGKSLTFDSAIIKPELKIIYTPYLTKNTTNFIFFASHTNFANSIDKQKTYFSIRFDYKVRPYSWLKIGYKVGNNNFLRFFQDEDSPSNDFVKCIYDSENAYFNYSFKAYKKGFSKFEFSKINHFFNPSFTEFDLDINKVSFYHSHRFTNYYINLEFSNHYANNNTFDNGMTSSAFDRSFDQNDIKLSIEKKNIEYLKNLVFGLKFSERIYSSNVESDPLHNGRMHAEYVFLISALKEFQKHTNIELKYSIRFRKTDSEFDWVESLKTFDDISLMLKITRDIDIDLFY